MTTMQIGAAAAGRGALVDVVGSSREQVAVVDASGLVLHVNLAVERSSGFRVDEIVGRHVAAIYPDTQGSQWEDILAGLFSGDSWTGEVACACHDGTRHAQEASVTPVINGDGQIAAYVVMTRDASARRELEVRTRQAARMEALGRLASGIAHDFNNLLSAILGFGEFVQLELPEGSPARQDMDQVIRAADSAAELTRQLLAFGRQHSSTPARLDLATVVESTTGMLRRLLGDDIELITALGEGARHVCADARGLEQLLVNLVLNARDAMPGGGTVRVGVGPASVQLEDGRAVEVVRLTVADTGTGMSRDTLARFCEPFFTTKEPGRGTGLGLTTVTSVTEAAGATMTVASELGEGTTVTIDFPAVERGEELAETDPATPPIGGCETVLLVEDDASLRSIYARHLRELGYRVAAAPNAEVGLRLSTSAGINPDVVVSDVALPGMHGPEFVRILRRTIRDLPAVMISGLPRPIEGDEPEWADLRKPFTAASLAAAVRGQIDRRRSTAVAPSEGW